MRLQLALMPLLLTASTITACTPAPPSTDAANGTASDSVVTGSGMDDEALERLVGYFHIVWGDEPRYWLIDDGEWTALRLSESTELPVETPDELVGRRIVVAGTPVEGAGSPAIRVVSIELEPEDDGGTGDSASSDVARGDAASPRAPAGT